MQDSFFLRCWRAAHAIPARGWTRPDAEVHPAPVDPGQRRLAAAMPPRLQPMEVPLPLLRALRPVPLSVLALAPEVVR